MLVDPAVIRIRTAGEEDAPGIARAHICSWQTAYRGILPDSFLDALEPSSREERWRERLRTPAEEGITFVAEKVQSHADSATEIVGFASGGPERDGFAANAVAYQGEIYALYLLPEHRRRGIGRRLVAASIEWLLAHDLKSIVIWALEENGPARAFYKGLGGILIGNKTVTIGPSNLVDIAYGWPDGEELLRAARGRAS